MTISVVHNGRSIEDSYMFLDDEENEDEEMEEDWTNSILKFRMSKISKEQIKD